MDLNHVDCGVEGWAHLAAVVDYHDRQVIGYEFACRGGTREVERARERACLARIGTLRPADVTPTLRSDRSPLHTVSTDNRQDVALALGRPALCSTG